MWSADVNNSTITGSRGNGSRLFIEREFLIVLIVAKNIKQFSTFIRGLQRLSTIELVEATTGAEGFLSLQGKQIDLVIVDEQFDDMSGIAFVKQLVKINPLVNTAMVSTLADHDFHEATEGLGVLMQLPVAPGEKDAEALLGILEKIGVLLQPMAPPKQKAGRS